MRCRQVSTCRILRDALIPQEELKALTISLPNPARERPYFKLKPPEAQP